MSNQAAVLYAPHDIRIEERPIPKPGPREVLIEIKAVGVCGSDVHYYEHGRIGSYVVRQPLILGEAAGIIVDVGEGANKGRGRAERQCYEVQTMCLSREQDQLACWQ